MVMIIKTDPQKEFQKSIAKTSKGIEDIRPALNQVKKQWYQGNKSIFALQSAGKYEELSLKYEKAKVKELGFDYPLLRGKYKRIENAITKEDDKHAYSKVSKKNIELGVVKSEEFPYAFSIHYGSKKQNIPARPYVLLGVEQVSTPEISKKPKVYLEIIQDYIVELSRGA